MQSSRLVAFSALVTSQLALAETVRMKNGTVLHGAIVQMTETDLTLDTADMGQVVLKRRAIEGFDTGAETPTAALTPGAAPAAAAVAVPAIAINNNNNNNNNNAATSAAAVAAAPTPAPQAAPSPAPAPEVKSPAPMGLAVQAESGTGFVLGKVAIGAGKYRLKKDWSEAAPLLHWDVIGYHWDNGLSLTAFGEGIQEHKVKAGTERWLQGGLRLDVAFAKTTTRFGNANVYAGLGGTYLSLTRRFTESGPGSSDYDYYGYYYGYYGDSSVTHQAKTVDTGTGGVATLGYQVLGNGGLGMDIGLMASTTRTHEVQTNAVCGFPSSTGCGDRHPNVATASVTFGVSYAL